VADRCDSFSPSCLTTRPRWVCATAPAPALDPTQSAGEGGAGEDVLKEAGGG